jgi:hypothetical protein
VTRDEALKRVESIPLIFADLAPPSELYRNRIREFLVGVLLEGFAQGETQGYEQGKASGYTSGVRDSAEISEDHKDDCCDPISTGCAYVIKKDIAALLKPSEEKKA